MPAVDRKEWKPHWSSEKKASDVKIFSQAIINRRLQDLTNNREMAYRTILTLIRSLSSFLKIGTADEDSQQEGKQNSAKHLLHSLARTGESSGEHILRTMAGILLDQWLWMYQDCRLHKKPFWQWYSLS